ncbi:MAG TPA: RDD family protein, partial [Thermoanaerobaculia bacterium]|nr:RDD family protein [Thermoanaerobaculia bacterium]
FVANVLYFAGLWAIRGRTPGYALLHLAVVRRGVSPGQGIGWKAAILRFLFFVLGAVPLYAGWWIAFFSTERLAWHDRVAGTRVVRTD